MSMARRCFFSAVLMVSAMGCSHAGPPEPGTVPDPDPAAVAIQSVLAADEVAGARRNEASRHRPLHRVVADYVADLQALDTARCPADFTAALADHREAWRASEEFFARYDGLRGEMHVLFERIRAMGEGDRRGLEEVEEAIWGTWDEVEAAARRHGALTAEPD